MYFILSFLPMDIFSFIYISTYQSVQPNLNVKPQMDSLEQSHYCFLTPRDL